MAFEKHWLNVQFIPSHVELNLRKIWKYWKTLLTILQWNKCRHISVSNPGFGPETSPMVSRYITTVLPRPTEEILNDSVTVAKMCFEVGKLEVLSSAKRWIGSTKEDYRRQPWGTPSTLSYWTGELRTRQWLNEEGIWTPEDCKNLETR